MKATENNLQHALQSANARAAHRFSDCILLLFVFIFTVIFTTRSPSCIYNMYIYICIHHIHKFICVTSVSQTIFISLSSSLTSESIWYTQTVFSFVLFLQKAYFIYIFILCTVCVFFLIYWCGQHVQHVSLAAVIFRSTGIVTSQCRRTDYPKYSSFIYKHICNARLATVMPLVPLTTTIVLLSIYINSLTFCIS